MLTKQPGLPGTIRRAKPEDACRLAEIEVFNYRLNFYPIFRSDEYYFDELRVDRQTERWMKGDWLKDAYVYDDGVVKGFIRLKDDEVVKLFVEPVLHGQGIGAALLEHAVAQHGVRWLWALEKNEGAVRFYARHGFMPSGERTPEEDTDEYLVKLVR